MRPKEFYLCTVVVTDIHPLQNFQASNIKKQAQKENKAAVLKRIARLGNEHSATLKAPIKTCRINGQTANLVIGIVEMLRCDQIAVEQSVLRH